MEYTRLFDMVRCHLESLGIACTVRAGKVATEKSIARIEGKIKVRIPAELREFYQTAGDGFVFFWEAASKGKNQPYGILEMPTLKELARMYTGWREMVLYSPEEAAKYGFPYTEDPALAKRTAARMWHWLPLIDAGNGDMFCLDFSGSGCPVIFNKHDWLDGGNGDNGHWLASNLRVFLVGWGSVCFQVPKRIYWPYCIRERGGVDWGGDEFRDPYKIMGPAESGAATEPAT